MQIANISKIKKGFSLIELVVAFAMLIIISGVLLHMFVLATKINKKGSDYDNAHMLVTHKIEELKSTVTPISNIYYYNKSWTLSNEDDSFFKVEVIVDEKEDISYTNIKIDPIFTIEYDQNTLYEDEIEFTLDGSNYTCVGNLIYESKPIDNIISFIPVQITNKGIGNIDIAVTNKTDKAVKFYVLKETGVGNINIIPVTGTIDYTYEPINTDEIVTKDNKYYEIKAKVLKKDETGSFTELLLEFDTGYHAAV